MKHFNCDGESKKLYSKLLKNNQGVTLTVLVITIVVLLIIASIVIINATTGMEQRALNNMYNDIRILDGKIALYYEKYAELPIKCDDNGVNIIFNKEEVRDTEKNPNDNDIYFVIDKNKLENMNLSYSEDTYVINEQSHTIYYINGINVDGKTYYKLPIQYEKMNINIKYTVTYCPGEYGTFGVQEYGNITYGEATPEFKGEKISNDDSMVFAGWVEENTGKIGIYKTVERNAKYVAQWSSLEQELNFELFGGVNTAENEGITSYIIGKEQRIYNPIKIQKNIEYERVKIPECDIYMFDGWYLDEEFINELNYKISDTGEKEYYISERGIYPSNTLYAKWVAPAAKIESEGEEILLPGYSNYEMEFNYTGDYQEFIVPITGTYKIQLWGAQGGYRSNSSYGGKGGYTEGEIKLKKGEIIYIYVGGSGNTGGTSGGFNGGGQRGVYNGGGGATDIRVEGNTLYNRILVAGGGGSDGATSRPGKAGGGLTGQSATESYGTGGEGATQTSAGTRGSFGQGGSGVNASGGYAGAGGGGWYGGGGSTPDGSGDDDRGGGGGSGFVYDGENEVPAEYAIKSHIITNGKTISGTESIPTYDGETTMIGNTGNGYAKLTLNEEYIRPGEYYATLYDAIQACEINGQDATEIIVLRDLNEFNVVNNNKNILINLNGKTVQSDNDINKPTITVQNGKLTITDTSYESGKIVNNKVEAIKIEENGVFTLGIEDDIVWNVPTLEGGIYGINNDEGIFNYYDGKIIGDIAIKDQQKINDLAYLRNPGITKVDEKQVATLVIISNVEATIGKKTFQKLEQAINYANVYVGEDGSQVEIVIVKDLTKENEILVNETKNIKLNLNGYITNLYTNFINEGKLEIVDTSEEQTGKISSHIVNSIINKNTMNISSGTITTDKVGTNGAANYIVKNESTLIMNGGKIEVPVSYMNGIYNVSNFQLDAGNVNVNASSSSGIYNALSGKVKTTGGKIDVYGSASYGIYNVGEGEIEFANTELIANAILYSYSIYGIWNNNSGNVKIISGILQKGVGCGYTIYNNAGGTIEVLGGKIYSWRGDGRESDTAYGGIYNTTGKVIIRDGLISSNGRGIYNYRGSIEMYSGTINARYGICIHSYSYKTVDIFGGNITGSSYGIENEGTGTITLYGGTISSNNCGIRSTVKSTIIIDGGNINAGYECIYTFEGIINVKKGTLNSTNSTAIYNHRTGTITLGVKDDIIASSPIIVAKTYGVYTPNGTFNFYDGEITASLEKSIAGIITEIPENAYLEITENTDGETTTETARIIAEENIVAIGEKKYTSIESALQDSQEGDTITFLKNVQIARDIIVDSTKNVKMDLAGYKIRMFRQIFNDGTVEFIDSSESKSGIIKSTGTNMIDNNELGILSINGIKISLSIDTSNTVVKRTIYNCGNLTIMNSNISSNGKYAYGLYNKGDLNITGGNLTTNGERGYAIYNEGNVIANTNINTAGAYAYGINNNGGYVELIEGTINADQLGNYNDGILNTGYLKVDKTKFTGKNCRSTINNLGGNVEILDGTFCVRISNNSTGNIKIFDATIDVSDYAGIVNEGTGTIDINSVKIISTQHGIYNKSRYNKYCRRNYFDERIWNTK